MAKTKKEEIIQKVENADVVDITEDTVKPTNSINNGIIKVDESDISKAVGFDYSRQISLLSTKKRKEYLKLADSIVDGDIASIQQYGNEAAKHVEDDGNTILDSYRSNNINNEADTLINNLLAELNMLDYDDLNMTGFKQTLARIPGIRKLVKSIDKIKIKYDTIRNNVDNIANKIRQQKITAIADNNTLQIAFDNTKTYIKELRDLIIAAKIKNEDYMEKVENMIQHPETYSPIDIHDAQTFQNELEKRIANMQLIEYIFMKNLLDIRTIQSNNLAVASKADSIITTVVPLWKHELTIAIAMNHQKRSIETNKKIAATTNKIIEEMGKQLKENTIAVAKANEETIVTVDTLKNTTKNLIDTFKEVKKIQADGRKNRAEIEQNLISYGDELKNAINDIAMSSHQKLN